MTYKIEIKFNNIRVPKGYKICSHFPKIALTSADLIKEVLAKMAT